MYAHRAFKTLTDRDVDDGSKSDPWPPFRTNQLLLKRLWLANNRDGNRGRNEATNPKMFTYGGRNDAA
jgi:hypothetical protein